MTTATEAPDISPAFRDAMAALAATACVVTVANGSDRVGRTVTAALSLSVDPPSLLVSIKSASALTAMIRARGGFSFAMLHEGQRDVTEAFAGAQVGERRFDSGAWSRWPSGHPRLLDAVAAMDCTIAGEIEIGDHVLFVGRPVHIETVPPGRPLVWHDRQFNGVRPL